MSRLLTIPALFLGFLFSVGTALSAEPGIEELEEVVKHHGLTPDAPVLFSIPLPGGASLPFTNSMVMLFAAMCVITLIARLSTSKMKLIPSGMQNLMESIYEALFNFFAGIMGERLTRRTFWFIATSFILILASNWMGLIPGVGILTWTNANGEATPLFRGANADLNITLAMGILYAILWFYWTLTEVGFKNFIKELFAPKGQMERAMTLCLIPIFLLVGFIDCISILLRPITLGARLYGNIFAGEQIIETMSTMIKSPWFSWMPVVPFYMMELLVGFIQALVFTLLCAVFLSLSCTHEEEHPEDNPHS